MECIHSPACPESALYPQMSFYRALHSPLWSIKSNGKCYTQPHALREDRLRLGSLSHPYIQQGADRLVVTVSHRHVTLIIQLGYVLSFPKNTITPGWDSTLLTECICTQTHLKLFLLKNVRKNTTQPANKIECMYSYLESHSSEPVSYLYVGWKSISPSINPMNTASSSICLFS